MLLLLLLLLYSRKFVVWNAKDSLLINYLGQYMEMIEIDLALALCVSLSRLINVV